MEARAHRPELAGLDAAAQPVVFDPFDPAIHADLYGRLRRVRETNPVHFQPSMGAWLVSRHADVTAVFRDPRMTKAGPRQFLIGQYGDVGQRVLDRQLFFVDPPDHTRLRGLVARALTPRTVEGLRPRAEQVVNGLVDAALERGELDVVDQFAFRIPIRVLAGLFAVPDEDCPALEAWGLALFLSIGAQDPEILGAGRDALLGLHGYFTAHIDGRRRGVRGDTLLDALLDGVDAQLLSVEEAVQMAMQLTSAGGYDTTSNLIASGLWVLLHHPDEYARLRRDRSLLPNAVEELCRFEPPGQLLFRGTSEDVVLPSGGRLPAGALVGALVGGANHDESVFPDPDRLDLGRPNANQQLGFGQGIHYCVGAPPARLIAGVAFTAVMDRLPGLAPVEQTPCNRNQRRGPQPGVAGRRPPPQPPIGGGPVGFERCRAAPRAAAWLTARRHRGAARGVAQAHCSARVRVQATCPIGHSADK
jgi:cytochrome P450